MSDRQHPFVFPVISPEKNVLRHCSHILYDIYQLHNLSDMWRIRARILRKWNNYVGDEETKTVSLILVDGKGSKIHALIDKKYWLSWWTKFLKEDKTIIFEDFKLCRCIKKVRETSHDYEIIFDEKTWLRSIPGPVDNHFFSFVSFDKIFSDSHKDNVWLDVLGQLVNVGIIKRVRGSNNEIFRDIHFDLKNEKGQILQCKLRDMNSFSFSTLFSHMWEKAKVKPTICALQFVLIKKNKETNRWSCFGACCTKIFFNQKDTAVEELKTKLQKQK